MTPLASPRHNAVTTNATAAYLSNCNSAAPSMFLNSGGLSNAHNNNVTPLQVLNGLSGGEIMGCRGGKQCNSAAASPVGRRSQTNRIASNQFVHGMLF